MLPSPHTGVHEPDEQTGSDLHWNVQPSPISLLPSSHCSSPSRIALPHTLRVQGEPGVVQNQPASIRHCELQPSLETMLPSSHCSTPPLVFSRMRLPQIAP